MPLGGGLAGEEPPDGVPAVAQAARHQGGVTLAVHSVHHLPRQVLPLQHHRGLHPRAVQEEQEEQGLFGVPHHLVEVDVLLRVPVGEILVHYGGLAVDDSEHEGREAGGGGQGEQLAAVRVEAEGPEELNVAGPAGDMEEGGAGGVPPL